MKKGPKPKLSTYSFRLDRKTAKMISQLQSEHEQITGEKKTKSEIVRGALRWYFTNAVDDEDWRSPRCP